MQKTRLRPFGVAWDTLVMECPECNELMMVSSAKLENGHRVRCGHCRKESRLTPETLLGRSGPYWTLVPVHDVNERAGRVCNADCSEQSGVPVMPTLDVNPDNVCRLIQLAREFHAQDAVVIPDEPGSPADDWPVRTLAAYAGDSTLAEFRSIVTDLDRDQQTQVVALLWLGRGDYEVEDWDALLEDTDDAWTPYTADYLIAHPLLAEYLGDGLELLGYRCD